MTKKIIKNAPPGATHFCKKTGSYWMVEPGSMALKWSCGKWNYSGPTAPAGMIDLHSSGKTVWAVIGILFITFILWVQS